MISAEAFGDAPRDSVAVEWEALRTRCADILPYFAELRLNMSATRVAMGLGRGRADVLGRILTARGLPPYRVLRDWVYVVQLVERFPKGESLAKEMARRGDDPSSYYHLVRRVSRQSWLRAQAEGSRRMKVRALECFWAYRTKEI